MHFIHTNKFEVFKIASHPIKFLKKQQTANRVRSLKSKSGLRGGSEAVDTNSECISCGCDGWQGVGCDLGSRRPELPPFTSAGVDNDLRNSTAIKKEKQDQRTRLRNTKQKKVYGGVYKASQHTVFTVYTEQISFTSIHWNDRIFINRILSHTCFRKKMTLVAGFQLSQFSKFFLLQIMYTDSIRNSFEKCSSNLSIYIQR